MLTRFAAVVIAMALGSAIAAAETKTITVDGCTKVETEYVAGGGGGPPTMTVKCTGETAGPRVRQVPTLNGLGYLNVIPGTSTVPGGTITTLPRRCIGNARGDIEC